mmetsp:Transcript_106890/g.307411  ORF Transcript_106890/g.307411 Transcript_106890/m.307411 type:complete len:156 (+) Transcript_106890:596-1063(+)
MPVRVQANKVLSFDMSVDRREKRSMLSVAAATFAIDSAMKLERASKDTGQVASAPAAWPTIGISRVTGAAGVAELAAGDMARCANLGEVDPRGRAKCNCKVTPGGRAAESGTTLGEPTSVKKKGTPPRLKKASTAQLSDAGSAPSYNDKPQLSNP